MGRNHNFIVRPSGIKVDGVAVTKSFHPALQKIFSAKIENFYDFLEYLVSAANQLILYFSINFVLSLIMAAATASTGAATAATAMQTQVDAADSCTVCFNDFNRTTYKCVTCYKCNHKCCVGCMKQTILSNDSEAHCMSCKVQFSHRFLVATLKAAFVNKAYRQHMQKLLFERQLALLPATQPIAEARRRDDAIRAEHNRLQLEVARWERKQAELQVRLHSLDESSPEHTTLQTQVLEMFQHVLKCQRQLREHDKVYARMLSGDLPEVARQSFVRKCPADNCKGFLSTQWKCGLCDTYSCKECHDHIGEHSLLESHKCDADKVATAKLLATDTKNCPKCATPIFKISGCDQMYCTQCHTAFSWRTGLVETGVIHNPHYFAYLRSLQQDRDQDIPRQPGDNACADAYGDDAIGNVTDTWRIQMACTRHSLVLPTELLEFFDKQLHIRLVDIPNHTFDLDGACQNARVSYLLNKHTAAQFSKKIYKFHKESQRSTEQRQIIETELAVAGDLWNKLLASLNFDKPRFIACFHEITDEIDGLRRYLNNEFALVAKVYGNISLAFDHRWALSTVTAHQRRERDRAITDDIVNNRVRRRSVDSDARDSDYDSLADNNDEEDYGALGDVHRAIERGQGRRRKRRAVADSGDDEPVVISDSESDAHRGITSPYYSPTSPPYQAVSPLPADGDDAPLQPVSAQPPPAQLVSAQPPPAEAFMPADTRYTGVREQDYLALFPSRASKRALLRTDK